MTVTGMGNCKLIACLLIRAHLLPNLSLSLLLSLSLSLSAKFSVDLSLRGGLGGGVSLPVLPGEPRSGVGLTESSRNRDASRGGRGRALSCRRMRATLTQVPPYMYM